MAVLENKGFVEDELRTRILDEKNLEKLHFWLRVAAKAESVEAFSEQLLK